MKKNDLKKLIKPLVKECIHEVLIEEGLLSNVVAEVAKGMQGNLVVESHKKQPDDLLKEDRRINRQSQETRLRLKEQRKKLMSAINADAYNGVDLFEGTQPMSQYESKEPKAGAVDLGNPGDSGVDISSLIPGASKIWDAMK